MPAYTHVMVLDEAELICRMAEAYAETKRPDGWSAQKSVDVMDPRSRADWLRVATAVRKYWEECADGASTVQ